MADTILSGDWTITYSAENREKSIRWSGSATGTTTVRALYSALQDHFDNLTQLDDGSVMSGQTPTEFTIGIIDPGDGDPWFIDRSSVEHLTGGALKTASWKRDLPGDDTGNTGILRITCNNTDIVAGDIGFNISHTNGDVGTLLDVKGTGAGSTLWVRPDTNALADDFNDSSGTLTCNAHTATQSAAGVTGESLWANTYSIGTIEPNTHLYIIQNGAKLTSYASGSTYDWWPDGQIDILVNVKEVDTEVDEAVIQVFPRQYSKSYDVFEVDLTTGGRNPIPLATADDLDNTTGYRQITATTSSGTGTFDEGDIIGDTDTFSTSTKLGIVTKVAGTGATPIIDYYLIGDLTDWTGDASDVYDQTGDGYCTDASVTGVGPGALAGVTITHGSNETYDIDENGTTENYSIVIDCSDELLADVYEWTKYLTMRGGTTTGNTDSLAGEQYIGSDYKIVYTTLNSGPLSEGTTVTQQNTAATGTVVSHNTTDKIIILRNSRGTFNNTDQIDDDTPSANVTGVTCTVITPTKSAPFGTFAGGKWFCAPGVVLTNVPSADANNFQLKTDDGAVIVAPTKVTITVGNTRANDRVAVFRLTGSGGTIDKAEYTATAQSIGDATLVVGEAITADTPGISAGGIIRLVGTDEQTEYRLRFDSWATSTFTLSNQTGTMDDTGGTTTSTNLHDDGKSFTTTVKVGDLVLNTTRSNAVSYVSVVVDNSNLTIFPAIAGQVSGDAYEINAIPITTDTSDTAYVPLIDVHETTGTLGSPGTETAQITFLSNVFTRVRARNSDSSTWRILPYEADVTITNTGLNNNVIRTPDAIHS